MDYKEKYEMALEGIQEILSSGQDSIKMSLLQLRLQGIFPELTESEDELTWLIKHIEEEIYYLSMDIRDTEDRMKLKKLKKALAWLENKVQEKSNWGEDNERIRNDIRNLVAFALEDGSAIAPGHNTTKEEALAWLEKQGKGGKEWNK